MRSWRASLASLFFCLPACTEPRSGGAPTPSASAAPSATPAPAPAAPASVVTEETKAALAKLARSYRGTIGKAAGVVLRLTPNGDKLTGAYAFPSEATSRELSGAASGGHVTLDEMSGEAKAGTLTLDIAGDGSLTGESSDGGAVHLEAIPDVERPTAVPFLKRVRTATKPVLNGPKGDVCRLVVKYPEVYGLPATLEAKLNAELRPTSELALPDKCDHATEISSDYRVAYNAKGILSVRITNSVKESEAKAPPRGRSVSVMLASRERVNLFGDVVKPKAERTFESAMNHQMDAIASRNHLDAAARGLVDQALGFSPPFVIEERGVRLFPESLPPALATITAEGVFVPFSMLPRPAGPVGALW